MPKKPQTLLGRFLVWRIKYISHPQFVYILSILIGFASGMGAVTLKNTTHFIQEFVHGQEFHHYTYFLFPLLGILITVLIAKYVIRESVGHGIPSTLYAISRRKGIMRPYQMYASILTAPFTVGFGGSVGLEGPTVATGSALGSNIARMFHMNQKTRMLLIGSASAGAMSAIFKAPIASIIFAIEVFGLDLTFASLVPLLVSSVSAFITSSFFMGNDILLHFSLKDTFRIRDAIFFIVLGVVSAFTSMYFTKMYLLIGKFFDRIKGAFKKLIIGGTAIGVIVFLIPPLYGEGFEVINSLLDDITPKALQTSYFSDYLDNPMVVILLLSGLVIFKIIATATTFGAGGVGGIFAPTLFMGSIMGNVCAKVINILGLGHQVSETNFTLAGMAGLMAGVLHAPLTAIFLIAELTGGYGLFVPLMITSAISFTISKHFIKHSVYTTELAKKGQLITHNKDKTILGMLKVEQVLETNFVKVNAEMNLGALLHHGVAKSKRNVFPVVNSQGMFEGMVMLNDIRHIMFETNRYEEYKVADLMIVPEIVLDIQDSMESVMKKFQDTSAWNLPVISNGKYMGFISKSKLLTVYRRKLMVFAADE